MQKRTGGFVGGLSKKSGDLSLLGVGVSGGTEAAEGLGGGDEGVVGVEPFAGAGSVVSVLEHLVEEVLAYDRTDVGRCSHQEGDEAENRSNAEPHLLLLYLLSMFRVCESANEDGRLG